ncbi:hypothetical protein AABB24_027511 [Solanum stoloniferum]|uniref:Uncharacterized protein n=1 Tax=Solanum stoloniferum TaxID=62892 RepID=A0ABD2S316_9SOLN
MDIVSKDDPEPENMFSDWQLSGSNLTNTSNRIIDSFCASVWDNPISSSNLGFCGTNIQMNPGAAIGLDPLGASVNRMVAMGWTQPNVMSKGGAPTTGMVPQSLTQLSAESGFIERATRFSCFSGGKVGDMMNHFAIPNSSDTYHNGLTFRQSQEVFASNGLQSSSTAISQKQQMRNAVESSDQDVSLPLEYEHTDRSPIKNEKNVNFVKSQDEAKECVGISENESECSGHQEEVEGGNSSARCLGSRKRKRSGQDTEFDQMNGAQQQPAELTKEQNLNSIACRPGGKNGDPPKEDYIHIRARKAKEGEDQRTDEISSGSCTWLQQGHWESSNAG